MGARMTFFRGYWYTLYKSSETERYGSRFDDDFTICHHLALLLLFELKNHRYLKQYAPQIDEEA